MKTAAGKDQGMVCDLCYSLIRFKYHPYLFFWLLTRGGGFQEHFLKIVNLSFDLIFSQNLARSRKNCRELGGVFKASKAVF